MQTTRVPMFLSIDCSLTLYTRTVPPLYCIYNAFGYGNTSKTPFLAQFVGFKRTTRWTSVLCYHEVTTDIDRASARGEATTRFRACRVKYFTTYAIISLRKVHFIQLTVREVLADQSCIHVNTLITFLSSNIVDWRTLHLGSTLLEEKKEKIFFSSS